MTKTALVAHQCFGYCWVVVTHNQGFFFSHSVPPVTWLKVWRGHSQEKGPELARGIFHLIVIKKKQTTKQQNLKGGFFKENSLAQRASGNQSIWDWWWVVTFTTYSLFPFSFSSFLFLHLLNYLDIESFLWSSDFSPVPLQWRFRGS